MPLNQISGKKSAWRQTFFLCAHHPAYKSRKSERMQGVAKKSCFWRLFYSYQLDYKFFRFFSIVDCAVGIKNIALWEQTILLNQLVSWVLSLLLFLLESCTLMMLVSISIIGILKCFILSVLMSESQYPIKMSCSTEIHDNHHDHMSPVDAFTGSNQIWHNMILG